MSKARLLLVAVMALMVPAAAWAQGGTSGAIVGYVFDESGMPLKGVKVTASSPTQIGGAKNAYTNDEGAFRIKQLSPGTFEVRAAAPKLETVLNKGVKVGITSETELNIIMKVQIATEVVSVVEKPPVIKTTKANITESFDLDMVEALPHASRDNVHNQVINDVAGGMNGRVRGGSQAQTLFTQDGFEMRGQFPTLKSSAAYEVNTGGFGVDNPMAAGGSVNLVTKSGSNKFEFEFNATADSNRLRFFRDENDSPAATYFYVINPMISGPIVKDKLWFHFNTESHIIQNGRDPDTEGYFPNPEVYRKFIQKGTLKLTWQVTGRNKLASLTNFDSPHEWNMVGGLGVQPEAQQNRHGFRLMTGLIWESLLTDSVVLRSQVGYITIPQRIYPRLCETQPDTCNDTIALTNTFPRTQRSGNLNDNNQNLDNNVWQAQNSLEFFIEDFFGSHALKIKDNFLAEEDIRRFRRPTSQEINGVGVNVAETQYYANDPRLEPEKKGWWVASTNVIRHTATISDTWKITRFLTLIPALSHVYANGSNSYGDQIAALSGFAPAASLAWDATHDGRTVLRTSYNQYVDINVFDLARHTIGGQVSQKCLWDPATSSYSRQCEFSGGRGSATFGSPCSPQGFDERGNPCRQSLGIPRTYEYTAGAEREVSPGISMSFDVVYKDFQNQFETKETNRIWNNAGTALAVTGGYRNGRAERVNDLSTPDEAKRSYRGATLGLNKREGRLRAKASYTLSSLVGNVFDGVNNAWGDVGPQDVYQWGYLPDDHRHEMKLQATYSVTPWLSAGFRYRYFSGTPYNRFYPQSYDSAYNSLRSSVGINPGTDVNNPEDDRELRLPDQQDFNAQIRANLMPLLGQQLDFYVDVLNVLGLRTTTGYGQEDGRDFGVIRSRMNPLTIRLGLNYKY